MHERRINMSSPGLTRHVSFATVVSPLNGGSPPGTVPGGASSSVAVLGVDPFLSAVPGGASSSGAVLGGGPFSGAVPGGAPSSKKRSLESTPSSLKRPCPEWWKSSERTIFEYKENLMEGLKASQHGQEWLAALDSDEDKSYFFAKFSSGEFEAVAHQVQDDANLCKLFHLDKQLCVDAYGKDRKTLNEMTQDNFAALITEGLKDQLGFSFKDIIVIKKNEIVLREHRLLQDIKLPESPTWMPVFNLQIDQCESGDIYYKLTGPSSQAYQYRCSSSASVLWMKVNKEGTEVSFARNEEGFSQSGCLRLTPQLSRTVSLAASELVGLVM